ncbi:class A beta-lactamase [Nevskia sp.]|uniref:class A beta-lactamase n=1 Tax=Nevskia sp. TaxID=1929292 RepID=UPI0025EE7DE5|nr:class A beta-lactamase [Nevskia sp.]
MDRRTFNRLVGLALATSSYPLSAQKKPRKLDSLQARCKALEAKLGGRLGINCIEVGSGRMVGYKADERFPMCSTFKWLAAAVVLSRVDAGQEQLGRRIQFSRDELMEWSPVTEPRLGGNGMTLGELCDAAITESDNTAANLILRETGGIPEWNRYMRSIGDAHSRLDRGEPLLNEALPGDVRDTSTPAAMTANLRRLLLEDQLSPASREQLTQWMLATKTSDKRLRAGLPAGWRLADKTGTGFSDTGTAGDVGVLWSPSGKPIIIAVYLTRARVSRAEQEAAIADIGRWIRDDLQRAA